MRVFVLGERSGRVRDAFAARGHDAWSCDLYPSVNGGKHIRGDALKYINDNWDIIIAHPPCTYLSRVQNVWYDDKFPDATRRRKTHREKAIEFFLRCKEADCEKIAIENPVPQGYVKERIGDYDQIVEPWMFGDPFRKKTCLWLKGLPILIPTNIVDKGESGINGNPQWYIELPRDKDRSMKRSVTFQGIANAMAAQWG